MRSLDYAHHIPDEPAFVLHGQSMGAAAILRAASLQPLATDALLLECPFDSLRATTRHRFEGMGVPSFPAADLLLFWGGVQQGFNPFIHNPVAYALHVRTPTLLMNGDSDQWVRMDEIQAVYDGLQGHKRLKIFPGVGHESYLRHRDAWAQSVSGFLAEHARIGGLEEPR